MVKDYYQALGIPRDATQDEVRRAFRRKAMAYHPDRNLSPEAGVYFREANEAYQVLSDAERRRRYDSLYDVAREAERNRQYEEGARESETGRSAETGSSSSAASSGVGNRTRSHGNSSDVSTTTYAPRLRRLWAFLLDLLIVQILFNLLSVMGLVSLTDPGKSDFLIDAAVMVAYHSIFTIRYGQTLGKRALGIQVVDTKGDRPTTERILVRETIARALPALFVILLGEAGLAFALIVGLISVAIILLDAKRQGPHDKAAKTFVVKK